MKHKALAAAIMLATTNLHALEGQVVDSEGTPIVGAKITTLPKQRVHSDELPVFLFEHLDAEFYGLEAQVIWKLNNQWKTTFFSDFVHAELTDGRSLPRTPPLRFGADVDFTHNRLTVNLNWTHYAKQDKVG